MRMPAFKSSHAVGFVAVLFLLLTGGQIYRCLQSYLLESQSTARARTVLTALDAAAVAVDELASGQRAYINTGQTIFIAQREYDLNQVRAALSKVDRLTADELEPQLRSNGLSQLMQERRQFQGESAAAYNPRGMRVVSHRMLTSEMPFDVGSLLASIGEMQEQARALLTQRSEQLDGHVNDATLFAAMLVGGVLVAVVLLYGWAICKARPKRTTSQRL